MVLLKYMLDIGLIAPVAIVLMTLAHYFNFDNFLLPVQIVGMIGMLFNLYWLVFLKKKRVK